MRILRSSRSLNGGIHFPVLLKPRYVPSLRMPFHLPKQLHCRRLVAWLAREENVRDADPTPL
jgi:hypothetical protein